MGYGAAIPVRLFLLVLCALVLIPGSARADTTLGFDDLSAGTSVTTQYAGQGVVFGPLPGGAGNSISRPVVITAGAQAHSQPDVAAITCTSCNEGLGSLPDTTGSFSVQHSHVSAYVGLLGTPAPTCESGSTASSCAVVQLLGFDSSGNQVAASPAITITQGVGIHTLLSISTTSPDIVGFEVVDKRDPTDNNKDVAIDDLTFDTAASPPPPDFTLTPVSASVTVNHAQSVSDQILIGRLAGSSGQIQLTAAGLPAGIHAQFAPNPADSTSTLTLSADRTVQSATGAITVTGTPQSASAGGSAHSFTLGIQVTSACEDVHNAQDLIDAVGSQCLHINVDDSANIDLGYVMQHPDDFPGFDAIHANSIVSVMKLHDGVTLESDRSLYRAGGRIYYSQNDEYPKAMLELGHGDRVTGLRLQGDSYGRGGDETWTIKGRYLKYGLDISMPDILIDNDEISNWPGAGVFVHDVTYAGWPRQPFEPEPKPPRNSQEDREITAHARLIHITNNFIHDNVGCTEGYGVEMGGTGFALIDRNVFDYDKHDVAGGGQRGEGYVAASNLTLTDGVECRGDSGTGSLTYGGHFDMHGTAGGAGSEHVGGDAGTYIEIRNNAIRGDQRFHIHLGHAFDRRAAFDIRGTPTDKAIFAGNVTEAPDDKAIAVSGVPLPLLTTFAVYKLLISDNRYSVNTSQQLAVGDFDGDGCSDAFLPTGAVWMYSPCGSGIWRYLNTSGYRLSQLAIGDFNGDGKTDVFTQRGDTWYVSYGATTGFHPLPAGSNIPMSQYRFGDFDGDGKTDVFRANGKQWYYSSGGATPWKPLAGSSYKVDQLRLCDFNGDGKADLFSLANHQWSVSYGGSTAWHRLNKQLSANLGELVFADFDGSGRCDIARLHGSSWQVSWNGTSSWQTEPARYQQSVEGALVGHFAGGKHAGLLQFAYGGHALERFRLSTDFGPLKAWSRQNML